MSASIKLHMELLIEGVWHHYNHPSRVYDRQLYGIMASVGFTSFKSIFKASKGLPAQMSPPTVMDYFYDRFDAHHQSWLTPQEVKRLEYKYKEWCERDLTDEVGYFFGNSWTSWLKYPEVRKRYEPFKLTDWRWVFWFIG